MVKYAYLEQTLEIPPEVDFKLEGKVVSIKGEMGTNVRDFSHAREVDLTYDADKRLFRVYADFPRKRTIAKLRTIKGHVNNMVLGVTRGFTYYMKMVHAHFPHTVKVPGQTVQVGKKRTIKLEGDAVAIENFLGERAPRMTKKVGDVDIKVTKEDVIVSGIDKEAVGQTCANIQLRTKIKKKDPRIFQDGIYVYKKMLGDEVIWEVK
ncbi:MAG: 50S ribosomal protein L6 [Promethearchaeota archaeon]